MTQAIPIPIESQDQSIHSTIALAQTPRLEWVDIAKALGIILVVHGHTIRGLWNANILVKSPVGQMVDTWIYSFHMPLFFVLSGFFAGRSVLRGLGESLVIKLKTIAYPYVIWSVLQNMIQFAAGGATNNPVRPEEIWRFVYAPPICSSGSCTRC